MNQAKVFRIALLNVPTILGIIIGLSTAAIAGEPTRRDNTQQPSSIAQTPLNLEIPVPDAALETEELNPSATPETPEPSLDLDTMENQGMGQITNVSQLRDVSPGDWAYEALRSLVERYGCIAGYPDGTFRGNRAMTRYEFAAGLNACLQQIERLIGNVPDNIEELPTLRRLVEEFEAELATLGARVDNLEGRVAFLEDHQFSTTTKLSGEVIFGLVDAFGDEVGDDVNTVFHDRVRLNFLTSFTGKDMLQTRLQAGNAALLLARDGVTFDDGSQFTQEGRFTYDGDNGNDVIIDILRYRFPLGDKATVQIVANNGLHHYYVDTVNPFLEGLAGGSNAISRFAERNPIYRIGPFGAGAAIALKPSDNIRVDLGYISNTASNPGEDNGWVGKTDARLIGLGDADIWNFALGLVFPDLGKEGSFAAVVAGAEPTLRGLDVPGGTNDFNRDFAYHIEGFYKYQVSDNLSITPGIIWLTAPNQNSDNSDAVIGTVRTTFTF
ncbi:MAG: iron uptake porin [Coleofasciculus sp. A1-SPW-01]|uniref:iron uptake porin n=1 Tax=Coleofasciculus sp. A1-SPW-01 TaxID=3070819 RepID=UPI0032F8D50C